VTPTFVWLDGGERGGDMFAESVRGTENNVALSGSSATLQFESLDTLVAPHRLNAPNGRTPKEALDVALELQDPARVSSKDRTSQVRACASCHVAEGAVGLAKLEHGLSSPQVRRETFSKLWSSKTRK
jgi:cytochrome c553